MNTQTIELDGFEIEIASELYCDRGGDHRELVDVARIDRKRLGHNLDESAVLCVRCMKAIPTGAKKLPERVGRNKPARKKLGTKHTRRKTEKRRR